MLAKGDSQMADLLTQLETEVGNQTTVDDSVSALVTEMGALVLAAAPNNARVAAVVATLTANDARIAALVLANTPLSSGAPPVPPPVTPQVVAQAIPQVVQAAAAPASQSAVAITPATLSAAAAHTNAAKA